MALFVFKWLKKMSGTTTSPKEPSPWGNNKDGGGDFHDAAWPACYPSGSTLPCCVAPKSRSKITLRVIFAISSACRQVGLTAKGGSQSDRSLARWLLSSQCGVGSRMFRHQRAFASSATHHSAACRAPSAAESNQVFSPPLPGNQSAPEGHPRGAARYRSVSACRPRVRL